MLKNSTRSTLGKLLDKFVDWIEWYNTNFEIFLIILMSLLFPYIIYQIVIFLIN